MKSILVDTDSKYLNENERKIPKGESDQMNQPQNKNINTDPAELESVGVAPEAAIKAVRIPLVNQDFYFHSEDAILLSTAKFGLQYFLRDFVFL